MTKIYIYTESTSNIQASLRKKNLCIFVVSKNHTIWSLKKKQNQNQTTWPIAHVIYGDAFC